MSSMDFLRGLNPPQQQAVVAGTGPILVLAGPGSGKTRVLTHRIAYLIGYMGVQPYHILAVTFTNKAAREMESRVMEALGKATRGLTLGTFHATCARILRREAEHLPFQSNYVIFDADDQLRVVKQVLKDLNIDPKLYRPQGIHGSISRAKNELILPDGFPVQTYRDEIVKRVYERYQQALLTSNALDFDDLLLWTAYLLEEQPAVREKYARRYEHVLVDECLPYATPILLADGSSKPLGEIVEAKQPVHVLSFNVETKQQEVKTVIGWSKTPTKSKRILKITIAKRCDKRNRYKTAYKKKTIRDLICTEDHLVYANGEFIPARELRIGDILQWETSHTAPNVNICNECGEVYQTQMMHKARHKAYPELVCPDCGVVYHSKYQFSIHRKKHLDPDYKRPYELSAEGREVLRQRMLTDKPLADEATFAKAAESRRRFWDGLSPEEKARRVEHFIGAPLYTRDNLPTLPEQVINDLEIPELVYTGKGERWVTFSDGRHKCPDFVYSLAPKVVEVADFNYWHTQEEMEEVQELYTEIGYECLVLDAQRVVQSPASAKAAIEEFLLDCPVDVDVIAIEPVQITDEFVYDIAVEGNHNFYATGILVHNCQDTNMAQYALLKHLASFHNNIFAVGDMDQSIYAWRGADYRNLLRFEKDFPDAQVILLEQNYRSTQRILDAAMAVIDCNPNRTPKKLFTERGQGQNPVLHETYDDTEQAAYVVDTIAKTIATQNSQPGDFAVMYRTNAQSRVLEEAFLSAGLPYKLVGAQRFYGRREIKDVIAYLRLAHNPNDQISLMRVINVPRRGIGDKTILTLRTHAQKVKLTPGELLLDLRLGAESEHWAAFAKRAASALSRFGNLLFSWQAARSELSPLKMMERIIGDANYRTYIDDGTEEGSSRWENVVELHRLAAEYRDEGLETFLETVALVSDQDTIDANANVPTLLTMHAAKGLEFPVVFIVGLNEGTLPHFRSFDDPESMQEERRLFYVGITRAKNRLYLLHPLMRYSYGYSEPADPSRFLADIPLEMLNDGRPKSSWRKSKYRPEKWETSADSVPVVEKQYNVGMRVEHAVWGAGLVLNSKLNEGDEVVDIFFDSVGLKRVVASLAKLEVKT
ncbi:MAG: UvrD-helicase domain-containing protein [Chloroflexi bacterium]|nr:UvrD-helicase domain-containing protein [Chloroflexota bacterium]